MTTTDPGVGDASVPTASAYPGRTLTANSTLAFVLADMVSVILHESAHAVAGLAQGLVPTLSPFMVDYDGTPTVSQEISTALAGPFFSLVMGLVLMVVARRWGQGLVRLFFMWLAFMGVMNFVGYLFIAPIASAGDTGQALTLMHAPGLVFIAVGLVGVGGQFLLARRFAVEVKRYTRNKTEERQLAYFPWLIGAPISIALTFIQTRLLGVPLEIALLVLVAALSAGIFAPMQFILSEKVHNAYEPLALKELNVVGLVVTVVLAAALIALAGIGGVRLG